MRRRVSYLLVSLFTALAVMAIIGWRADWLLHRTPSPVVALPVDPKPRFAELADVLKYESEHGYTVAEPPRLPGPYRRLPDGACYLGRGSADASMVCRIRDDAGSVIEEIRLKALPDANQMVVGLDTADGRRTAVILRQTR